MQKGVLLTTKKTRTATWCDEKRQFSGQWGELRGARTVGCRFLYLGGFLDVLEFLQKREINKRNRCSREKRPAFVPAPKEKK